MGNTIKLKNGYSENKFIEDINEINEEKYD
jgi:hypothetical protein